MPLTKSGLKLKKIFEKEYQAKGYSKSKADSIFYGYESKHKFLKRSK